MVKREPGSKCRILNTAQLCFFMARLENECRNSNRLHYTCDGFYDGRNIQWQIDWIPRVYITCKLRRSSRLDPSVLEEYLLWKCPLFGCWIRRSTRFTRVVNFFFFFLCARLLLNTRNQIIVTIRPACTAIVSVHPVLIDFEMFRHVIIYRVVIVVLTRLITEACPLQRFPVVVQYRG